MERIATSSTPSAADTQHSSVGLRVVTWSVKYLLGMAGQEIPQLVAAAVILRNFSDQLASVAALMRGLSRRTR